MVGVQNKMPGVTYPPVERLERYVQDGVLSEKPLATALIEALPKYGDKIAIAGPEGSVSYAELDDQTNRFAAALLNMGLRPLDRVTFQVVNSKELLVALIACWKADLIPICTLAAHRKNEIAYLSRHGGARAHFIGIDDTFDYPSFAEDIRAEAPSMEHILVVRGEGPAPLPHMASMIAAQNPERARETVAGLERDPYQVTVFQLSGGTTSVPKIIPRFANEYLLNCEAVGRKLKYTEDDVVFVQLQLMHNAGTICAVPALLCGATVIASAALDPTTMLGVLKNDRPTVFFAMGAALARMEAANITSLVDFSRARLVISPNAARQTEQVLGVTGVHIYGMTEGVCTFGEASDPDEARYTTIGTPISDADEMRVVRPGTEEELPIGEVGELLIRGAYTFHGYYDAEERNREVFTADGF
ncbi:MAG: AMP-binding protein, partial [Caulobacterales bacterium]|nr:AMP-binding protein [Caulobacterales bacterium]